ncbi:lysosomal alpha-mannosidase-like isoform X1 [Diorhabda carinulata]|uniref:lysosomal alpha-mannosidase-like isoform X1 n=1 Tax=Diorhabda carinulata TaxID=1163345 RepID=UPI0025A188DF|nr:lysosomal alpha-mannosidase-like isoform X1 [Diorhabda carinulata]XP_057661698.1 lysosomal alpha-mannosidase-like isoform X1 [Diorhabda carinulata]XP_057661699.1 lysosomal alpha-mannosidase-like isoform X1 [Diorhabda carinulata]
MKTLLLFLAVFIGLTAIYANPLTTPTPPTFQTNCGYNSCHPIKDGDFINVHIVPHTHDDVGWLKTVDQYYYGSRNTIQNAGVQYILDSVMDSLRKDENRRFIYVETAFFWKWWIKQHDIVKARVRRFVNNGQLEFISGGWSMNDEATTHYQSIIDQMTWGLRKLNDSFGECGRPKMGWQIDPFGHSREMASIFAQLGFDGLLFGRIDYQDKTQRLSTRTPEMVWRGSQNLGSKSDLFTGVMFNVYSPPRGFCFDLLCSDEPIIDDKKSPDYNVDKRVTEFFEVIDNITKVYDTNNIIITMGEDFNYQDAHTWFKNIDKLIAYANARQANGSKYNLLYSTPSCYIKAIYDQTHGKKKWFQKQDDFFPYASDPHAFWTGYFTSRPTIKRFEREGNNFLQVCKQLYTLADLDPIDKVDLNVLREAMGVMQHHDAITGTEKQHVANDYTRILSNGFQECEWITKTALSKLVVQKTKNHVRDGPIPATRFTTCPLVNMSQCAFTETNNDFVVTIYNPLSRIVDKFIRVPITGNKYSVKDPEGTEIVTQIVPVSQGVLTIPGRKSRAQNELVFQAADIPPLGFKSYFVQSIESNDIPKYQSVENDTTEGAEFDIDPQTGLITQITTNGLTIDFAQEFLYYKGFVGNNSIFSNRSSGAYIFRPYGDTFKVANKAEFQVHKGPIVSEVHQKFSDWISQIIRVYEGQNYIEFDWLIGPIPIDDSHGKEIITRYKTSIKSNSTFYTDSNGRETIMRIRNFRPTWNLRLKENVSGNYYPVTTKIAIKDENVQLAILTDRAEGGSSLKDGEIELMIHRNCLHDDAFGVGEALNETAFGKGLVARGTHYVTLGSVRENKDGKTASAQERKLIQKKLLSAWTFVSDTENLSFEQYKTKYIMEYAGLKRSLPDNVQILTLEPWKADTFLLRLEHVIEIHEDAKLSLPVTVDLKDLFAPFEISNLQETTLGGNQWLSENHRLQFNVGSTLEDLWADEKISEYQKWAQNKWKANLKERVIAEAKDLSDDVDNLKILLNPMQIRTFILNIKK